jgi:4-hydroxy-2-oxoheptanedioate aldolase
MGIYVPHVQTAEDAKAVVQAVKYAPMGNRSAGSSERPANYGLTQPPEDYYAAANEETMVVLLVEDTIGVSNLDEIVQVPGIDVVAIGPGDLSLSLGRFKSRADPEAMKAVREAEARIARAGLPFHAQPTNADEAREAIDRGARLIPFFEGNMMAKLFRGVLDDLESSGTR